MTRHDARVNLFFLTFEAIFNNEDVNDLLEDAKAWEVLEISNTVEKDFLGIQENKEMLDQEICKYLNGWTIDRISKVSLAVLRIAMYEILVKKDVDIDVAISEAVIITGEYSLKEDVSFVNGVLSSVSKELKK